MKKIWTLKEMTSAGGKANTPAQRAARIRNAEKARLARGPMTAELIAKMQAGRRKKRLDNSNKP